MPEIDAARGVLSANYRRAQELEAAGRGLEAVVLMRESLAQADEPDETRRAAELLANLLCSAGRHADEIALWREVLAEAEGSDQIRKREGGARGRAQPRWSR